ncbi:hypothetical protein B0H19DRAFT_1095953 [Mycena capillaripes]|nr:hypothetical protein B0H19DRAFT_1095953 [Mycena capillaripes]
MSLVSAEEHPWLVGHKHTYQIDYPDELATKQSLTRTASLNSGASNPSGPPPRPAPARAVTEDPYADDYPQPSPVVRKLRTPPPPAQHAPVGTIAESGDLVSRFPSLNLETGTLPGLKAPRVKPDSRLVQRANDGQQPRDLAANSATYVQDSIDKMLYGGAPTPERQPGSSTAPALRVNLRMRRDNSSPLSSLDSPPPAPKKGKKGKIAKTSGTESKSEAPASSKPRKAKGKKKDESDTEKTTAVRRANRPARTVRR